MRRSIITCAALATTCAIVGWGATDSGARPRSGESAFTVAQVKEAFAHYGFTLVVSPGRGRPIFLQTTLRELLRYDVGVFVYRSELGAGAGSHDLARVLRQNRALVRLEHNLLIAVIPRVPERLRSFPTRVEAALKRLARS